MARRRDCLPAWVAMHPLYGVLLGLTTSFRRAPRMRPGRGGP